jgi:biopolymer transport protein ExbB/TolQ
MFLMESFKEGGWGMYPILILLALTVFIAIDRFTYLAKSKVDVDKLMSLLKSQIVSGNIQGAVNTCQASPAPVTKIIAAGLRKAGGTEHDVQQAMDEEALRELRVWRRRPATWLCWATWRPSPACWGPSRASSSRSPASPASTPR